MTESGAAGGSNEGAARAFMKSGLRSHSPLAAQSRQLTFVSTQSALRSTTGAVRCSCWKLPTWIHLGALHFSPLITGHAAGRERADGAGRTGGRAGGTVRRRVRRWSGQDTGRAAAQKRKAAGQWRGQHRPRARRRACS